MTTLQDRYIALQNKENDSPVSPTNKKVIKLSNNQAIKPSSPLKLEAQQSASEVSNYLEAPQRLQVITQTSPGTIHKVVMNRASAENLHSGSSNQELDSVDD